jgi:hypothetical protein
MEYLMSELAFDREGNPFRFSRRTKKLRPRRWKNPGQRGTCAAVLDADGEQVFIDADAEYVEFRSTVGNAPGFYRLDQCDEDGTPIEEAPPAYVEIESTRNAAPVGGVDPRDAIIRDLAQINADITRTMVERFSNVMQATADVLRAADGAGLPRREPPPPPSQRPAPDEEEDDDDQDEDDDESEPVPPTNPFGPFQPLVEMAMPHLPDFGAFLWTKFQEFWKQKGASFAVTAPEPAPAPAPGAPAAAQPSPGPEPGSAAAAPSAAATSTAPAPQAPWPPPPPPPPPPVPSTHEVPVAGGPEEAGAAASSPSVAAPSAVTQPPGAAFSTPTALGAHPAAMAPPPVAANGAISPAAASSTSPRLDAIPPSATTSDSTTLIATAEGNPPRNAMATSEPMPEPWAHVRAVLARLSPREAAITETVIGRMSPEQRAQWLANLAALDVGQAVESVRSMIPKPGAPPKAEAVPATKPPTTEPSTAAATSTKTSAVSATTAGISAAPTVAGEAPTTAPVAPTAKPPRPMKPGSAAHASSDATAAAKLPPLPPQAMGHFLAIQAALTPDEVAFLRIAASGLSPLQLRGLIEELSAISVPEAVARVRALLAEASNPEAA